MKCILPVFRVCVCMCGLFVFCLFITNMYLVASSRLCVRISLSLSLFIFIMFMVDGGGSLDTSR